MAYDWLRRSGVWTVFFENHAMVSRRELFTALQPSLSPVGPVGPVTPVSPVGPILPTAPTAPVVPVIPVGPVAPVALDRPRWDTRKRNSIYTYTHNVQ